MKAEPLHHARLPVALIVPAIVLALGLTPPAAAQHGDLPSLAQLEGTWFEMARFGPWWQQRCTSDSVFEIVRRSETRATLHSRCRTASGMERHDGVLDARGAGGRWRARFAPALFAWLPAIWGDFWVVGAGDALEWLVVGERSHTRLAVWSRTIALDEAAMARAVALARDAGFDVQRLTAVPHDVDAWRAGR